MNSRGQRREAGMRREQMALRFGSLLFSLALLALLGSGEARALPQCAPATPAELSKPGFYVDNAWQKYRTSPPEHRCCARVCEPIIRFAARIEKNALALNDIARNPAVPKAERDRALANANALFAKRSSLGFQFLTCLVETRPRGTGAAARCGETTIADQVLEWYAWCDAFSERQRRFRELLVSTVGNSVGTWQVQSNWFRISRTGYVDDDSVAIGTAPATKLPPGRSTATFKSVITKDANHFPAFPEGTANRMYMRYTASAVRLPGPAGTRALDTSVLIDGVCPGPRDRPPG
jgi:hypothetical protein